MTQTEAAKRAGITQGYLSQIINDERRPDWEIAKVLGELTGTGPVIWMEGSSIVKREAVKNA